MSTAHDHLDRIAGSQHGLITRAQLESCGFTGRQIERLAARAMLKCVRRGGYAISGSPKTWTQALMAAVLGGGESAVASHSSAARLWDFAYKPEDRFELTVARNFQVKTKGVRVHRSVMLDPPDVTRRDGVPCTSYERSLCDVTTTLSWLQLGRVLDDGIRRRLTTISRLRACAARLDSGPHRRLSVVQGLLAQRGAGFEPGGSNAELRLLSLLDDAGLPAPVQQCKVRVAQRTYYLDFAWPECSVFAEWYGLPWHIGASAVANDSKRITDLSSAGWRPLIFTDESTDAEIVTRTRTLLAEVGWIAHRRGA